MRQPTLSQASRPNHTPAFASSVAHASSPSTKGMLSDILVLSFWIAMIPAVLLVGSAAGF